MPPERITKAAVNMESQGAADKHGKEVANINVVRQMKLRMAYLLPLHLPRSLP